MPDPIILFDAEGNAVEVPTETPNVRQMRERISQLEVEAAKANDLQQQLETQQRQATFTAAGLELDEVKRRALESVHTGEWTPEAIKQTAVALGWAELPPTLTPQQQQDQDALARFNAAVAGGTSVPPDPDALVDQTLSKATNADQFMEMYRKTGRLIAP